MTVLRGFYITYFNALMETGYLQAVREETYSVEEVFEEVFEELEQGL